jgi:hypothetical protein
MWEVSVEPLLLSYHPHCALCRLRTRSRPGRASSTRTVSIPFMTRCMLGLGERKGAGAGATYERRHHGMNAPRKVYKEDHLTRPARQGHLCFRSRLSPSRSACPTTLSPAAIPFQSGCTFSCFPIRQQSSAHVSRPSLFSTDNTLGICIVIPNVLEPLSAFTLMLYLHSARSAQPSASRKWYSSVPLSACR